MRFQILQKDSKAHQVPLFWIVYLLKESNRSTQTPPKLIQHYWIKTPNHKCTLSTLLLTFGPNPEIWIEHYILWETTLPIIFFLPLSEAQIMGSIFYPEWMLRPESKTPYFEYRSCRFPDRASFCRQPTKYKYNPLQEFFCELSFTINLKESCKSEFQCYRFRKFYGHNSNFDLDEIIMWWNGTGWRYWNFQSTYPFRLIYVKIN